MIAHGPVSAYLRRQHLALVAMFLALTGGTAYALNGSNTVFSDDIVDGQVMTEDVQDNGVGSVDVLDGGVRGGGLGAADLRAGSVGATEVIADSLRGADVSENSLGTVPVAAIAGLGRATASHSDCATVNYQACASIPVSTQRTMNVLATAAGRQVDAGLGTWWGACRFAIPQQGIYGQPTEVHLSSNFLMTSVLGPVPAGTENVELQCHTVAPSNLGYPAHFNDMQLSVVGLAS